MSASRPRIHKVFDDVQSHLRIADLIQRLSTNKHGCPSTSLEDWI